MISASADLPYFDDINIMFLARNLSVGKFMEYFNTVHLERIFFKVSTEFSTLRMSDKLNISSKNSPAKNGIKNEVDNSNQEMKLPLRQLQYSELNSTVKSVKRKRTFTVAVEGNIGSGKSSFLKYFSSFPEVTIYTEPIKKWTNVGGHNLLQKLYENPKRWSFLFQSYVQLTRLQIHLDNSESGGVKLIERSIHNNRFCFSESDYNSGDLSEAEFEVICSYFDFLEKNFNIGVDLIVYLKTTPEVVYERMKKRGRTEEKSVPIEYLQKVHKYHERWLVEENPRTPHAPIITINGDQELSKVYEDCAKVKNIILGLKPLKENL